jgi:hypothetical protein
MALEKSPDSHGGKYIKLHLPACAQWFRFAGEDLKEACRAETETFQAGDLWKASGGSDVCNRARLEFWKARMREEGCSDQF